MRIVNTNSRYANVNFTNKVNVNFTNKVNVNAISKKGKQPL